MVKILASGEIVQDSDPRAKAAASQRRPASQSETARAAAATGSSSSSASASSSSSASSRSMGGIPQEENILVGDLARAVGVHGKTQKVMGHDIPLIYLIVGTLLAVLWVSGQMNAIRMLVFGFVLYVMYAQYQRAQSQGASMNPFGGGSLGGLGGGKHPDDNSSGGHVLNRGQPR
eukprot:gb/GFBE01074759.1/.p1 GENE.gb/GFBE01074759.1/~~gb/GFBE01074759.1/.p1  ORF type:complete len:175 (+),score=26.61 gb/GFBE01074759.1/:1-525(+)